MPMAGPRSRDVLGASARVARHRHDSARTTQGSSTPRALSLVPLRAATTYRLAPTTRAAHELQRPSKALITA